jgi:dephospho-CoA kinase
LKKEWGVPRIADIAQEIIDNSGTLEDLEKEGNRLIQQYC